MASERPQIAKLQLNPDGSLVQLEAGDWFVCFVPGIAKQWWHPFVHKTHKHVFAMRPTTGGKWTLFEPWWTRLLTATITSEQAKRFLRWGALGNVLLVREAIPGSGGQVRGWMNWAALSAYLLGRPYWVWTPHALYRRLLREPNVCHIDVSELLSRDLSKLSMEGTRAIAACEECRSNHPKRPKGALKPFCMSCGRDLVDLHAVKDTSKFVGRHRTQGFLSVRIDRRKKSADFGTADERNAQHVFGEGNTTLGWSAGE